jgi:hypothetical protein
MDENEKIVLGGQNGNGGNNNKPPYPGVPMDDEFRVPTEEVILPSKGVFYAGQKSTVKIKYLTAEEDNILFSTDLIKSGKVLDVLLEQAVLDKDLRPEDMISGDRNYLLIEIRKTGFGNEYNPGEVTCGSCSEEYRPTVDLNKLKPRMLEIMPDENGLYAVELPVTKIPIKFRLLRGSDEKRLSKLIESGQKKPGGFKVSRLITERYLLQIMEVNGNKDKTYISKFINAMPTRDSLFFREYNRQVEPGIDLDYEFECPYCSHTEIKTVPINSKLFYPDIE